MSSKRHEIYPIFGRMRTAICMSLMLCLSSWANASETIDYCRDQPDPLPCLRALHSNEVDTLQWEVKMAMCEIQLGRGQTDAALEWAQSAREISTDLPTEYRVKSHAMLANVYRRIRDHKTALTHAQTALKIAKGAELPAAGIYNTMGILWSQLAQFDSAKLALETGLAIAEAEDDSIGMSKLLTNLGFIHNTAERYDAAIPYYRASIRVKRRLGRPSSLAYSLNDLGEVYSLMGQYDSAIVLSKEALALVREDENIYYLRDMSKTLSNTYQMMGRFDSAYAYQLDFQHWQDSISNLQRARQIALLEAQHEINKRDALNEVLTSDNEAKGVLIRSREFQLAIAALVTLLLLMFGIALVVLMRQRSKLHHQLTQQYTLLQAKNRALDRHINEQESLFNIVTHDIRGPLANIIQLLNLEAAETDQSTKAELRALVNKSASKALEFIRDFDTIQRYEKRTEQPPKSKIELNKLVSDIIDEFTVEIKEKRIKIHFDANKDCEVLGVKEYVRHIIYNILSNAVKYSPESSSIFISIVDGEVPRISIEDQGPGIPEELHARIFERFFRGDDRNDNDAYQSSGLGLAVTRLLIEKMGGRIKLRSAPGSGSEFVVYFG